MGTINLTASPEAKAAGITAIPFFCLYRDRADYTGWFADKSIYQMVLSEYAVGTARDRIAVLVNFTSTKAPRPMVRAQKLMRFASDKNLTVLAHAPQRGSSGRTLVLAGHR